MAKPHIDLQYGHWGITVSQRNAAADYAPFACEFFSYPVSTRGPIDSAKTELAALDFARSLGGEPKGPFFRAA